MSCIPSDVIAFAHDINDVFDDIGQAYMDTSLQLTRVDAQTRLGGRCGLRGVAYREQRLGQAVETCDEHEKGSRRRLRQVRHFE